MTRTAVDMSSYTGFAHRLGDITYDVYGQNRGGSAIIVIHELSGLSPTVVDFADYLLDHGYSVYLPLFFGNPGCFQTI